MPTGYTAKLVQSGQTFQEFVMTCARAFGALITLRDDMTGTIPEKFEQTDYYEKKIRESRDKLSHLYEMDKEAMERHGETLKNEEITNYKKYIQNITKENRRLGAMKVQVKNWIPPTPDHVELKNFMLQQIEISKTDLQYYQDALQIAESTSVQKYFWDSLSKCTNDIKYSIEENLKEIERVNNKNKWLKELRDSIAG